MRSGYPVREKGLFSLNFPRGAGSSWNFPKKLEKNPWCFGCTYPMGVIYPMEYI